MVHPGGRGPVGDGLRPAGGLRLAAGLRHCGGRGPLREGPGRSVGRKPGPGDPGRRQQRLRLQPVPCPERAPGEPVLLAPQHLPGPGHDPRGSQGRDGAADGRRAPLLPARGPAAPRVQHPGPGARLPGRGRTGGGWRGVQAERRQRGLGPAGAPVPGALPGCPGGELRGGREAGGFSRPARGVEARHQRLGGGEHRGPDRGPHPGGHHQSPDPDGADQRHLPSTPPGHTPSRKRRPAPSPSICWTEAPSTFR